MIRTIVSIFVKNVFLEIKKIKINIGIIKLKKPVK